MIIIPKNKLIKVDSSILGVKNQIKGAGDLIEKMLSPLTTVFPKLKHCKGCKDRKENLNKLIPFKQ